MPPRVCSISEYDMTIPLHLRKIKPSTLQAYLRELQRFLHYAEQFCPAHVSIDIQLSMYMNYVIATTGSKARCANAYSGLIAVMPSLKRNLPFSEASLAGARKLVPTRSHAPIPHQLVMVMSLLLFASGQPHAATAFLCCFHCFLRIGELTSLRICDINDARRHGSIFCLSLIHTKTGPSKVAEVHDRFLGHLLRWIAHDRRKRGCSPTDKLFGLSDTQFRKILSHLCEALGLSHLHFTPHSFRHGAATYAYINGVSTDRIRRLGRWKSFDSLDIYVQAGAVALASLAIPSHIMDLGSYVANNLPACVLEVLPDSDDDSGFFC